MRSFLPTAAVPSLLAVCFVSPLAAQQPAAPAGTPSQGVWIAVIDIGYVLQHHSAFQQRMEEIKTEVKAFDAEVGEERKEIAKKGQRLRGLSPGSLEYRQLEEEVARQVSKLQVRAQLKRKEVLNQEAKNYYEAYNEILAAVAAVAEQYGIGLVLRFDRENIDPGDRSSVLRGVNRGVVYQRNLDVSQLVLDQIRAGPHQVSKRPGGGATQQR
jgi:Skp family chaperone for outer membrane proteins